MAWLRCSAQSQAQVLREGCFSRTISQVCRGGSWLPTLGAECTGEQHRTPSGPQQTFALGSLSEQVLRQRLQKPSLRVEAGERLLWGPAGWAREGAPPFPEAGEDPTVLAPLTLLPQTRLPPSFPSQGTKATPGAGQGPGSGPPLKDSHSLQVMLIWD